MTSNARTLGLVAVGVFAGYVLWRLNEAKGGAVVFVNPLQGYLPSNPSPTASTGTGATNPLDLLFTRVRTAFKLPGNSSADASLPASEGTAVDPVAPPSAPTRTAQPWILELPAGVDYAPNLGDANFSAWNYLASTPPDLAWGLTA